MITRLYGEQDLEHCKINWIPIIHSILNEGKHLNCADILSQNMTDSLKMSLYPPLHFKYIYYISAYLIDVFYCLSSIPNHGMELPVSPTIINSKLCSYSM